MNSYGSFDAMAAGTGALQQSSPMSVFNALGPQEAQEIGEIFDSVKERIFEIMKMCRTHPELEQFIYELHDVNNSLAPIKMGIGRVAGINS